MQPIRHAVILAAGQGARLAAVLPDRPKGFLELAGQPIVERSIRLLLALGVETVTIVTGYAAIYYEALARRYPALQLVHNPLYAESGSLYSLYCARAAVAGGPFLLLESDLVYEKRALAALLQAPSPTAILISGFTFSGDEVYVSAPVGRLVKMSKQPEALADIAGELVGLTKVAGATFAALSAYMEQCFQRHRQWHYEDGFNGIAEDVVLPVCKLDDLLWAEIDTPEHLRRVEEKILPQLLAEW